MQNISSWLTHVMGKGLNDLAQEWHFSNSSSYSEMLPLFAILGSRNSLHPDKGFLDKDWNNSSISGHWRTVCSFVQYGCILAAAWAECHTPSSAQTDLLFVKGSSCMSSGCFNLRKVREVTAVTAPLTLQSLLLTSPQGNLQGLGRKTFAPWVEF